MPDIVRLYPSSFDPPAALMALAERAALHEMVLVGAPHLLLSGRLAVLRQALAPRQMVALIVGDHVLTVEHVLVGELLNDGVIPVIVAVDESPIAALTLWLERDESCTARRLPDQGCTAGRAPRRRPGRGPVAAAAPTM